MLRRTRDKHLTPALDFMPKNTLPLTLPEIDAALTAHRNIRMPDGRFCSLSSAYQPVYSLAHKRIIGMEALVRAKDEQDRPISPLQLFNSCGCIEDLSALDRMARYVHVQGFHRLRDSSKWLFLNVHPQVAQHGKRFGSYFSELLDFFGLSAQQVVIEIVEHPIDDTNSLLETVEYYKNLGCLIALDDFGAGGSNFERVWALEPHIIKLDRSFIVQAEAQTRTRDILPDLIYLLRQAGCLVLMEGVETFEQALVAMESGVDFVQGYHFAVPSPHPLTLENYAFQELFNRFTSFVSREEAQKREKINFYQQLFEKMVARLEAGDHLETASAGFFAHEKCVRCFLLTTQGAQVGVNLLSPQYAENMDPRFRPLEDTREADWSRRFYLRRAVANPGTVQCTRPYLSLTGAHMCVTYSKTVLTQEGTLVLCCDVNWD